MGNGFKTGRFLMLKQVFAVILLSLVSRMCAAHEWDEVAQGVQRLIELQHEDGAWPYEGVYRVGGDIPVGYRIGGTAITCEAILYGADPQDSVAAKAINDGITLIVKELADRRMKPSKKDAYDVRVWGHIYACDLFCRLLQNGRFVGQQAMLEDKVHWLTEALVKEQLDDGGWNYATRGRHAPFVTAPAVQALLWARESGEQIDEEVFQRAAKALSSSRAENGAMAYSGTPKEGFMDRFPGSIARTPVSEYTLFLLGHDRVDQVQASIDAFHKHWEELEKRRKKTGTHAPPYGVAPYYFYYGHRYIPQAISVLPENRRAQESARFLKVLLKTRDDDGTWNDRVFEQSQAYGTAMAVLALLGDAVPSPPRIKLNY